MDAESDYENAGLTSAEARVAALRIRGLSYRAIAEEMGISSRTAWKYARTPHVEAVIQEGLREVVSGTVDQLQAIRSQAIDVLREAMEGTDRTLKVQAAREVLKVTEPKRSEVKVTGDWREVLRESVRDMSDEELGVDDD